jgi:chemotaxis signal transduction protein
LNTENNKLVPGFVVFRVGTRRIALRREAVAELVASPQLFAFPHTTPIISGVVLRRGRILPVLDLGPGVSGARSPSTRFFLVVERQISDAIEKCAIPVQGACELVSGMMYPPTDDLDFVMGRLDLSGEQIDVVDLEKAIAASAAFEDNGVQAEQVLS